MIISIKTLIEYFNRFIHFSCQLLEIRTPEIYYVQYIKNDTILRNNHYSFISNDKRDIGYLINSISFIPKEYVIYVNVNIFKNIFSAYALALRVTRSIFQLKQIIYFKKQKQLDIDETLARSWYYCYESSQSYSLFSFDLPTDVDRNAYSFIIMYYIFHIGLKYNMQDQERFEKRKKELFQEYRKDEVIKIFKKYQIKNPLFFEKIFIKEFENN